MCHSKKEAARFPDFPPSLAKGQQCVEFTSYFLQRVGARLERHRAPRPCNGPPTTTMPRATLATACLLMFLGLQAAAAQSDAGETSKQGAGSNLAGTPVPLTNLAASQCTLDEASDCPAGEATTASAVNCTTACASSSRVGELQSLRRVETGGAAAPDGHAALCIGMRGGPVPPTPTSPSPPQVQVPAPGV